MIDLGLLGDAPLQISKDMECWPESTRSTRGARTENGWFLSNAQCGRIWKLNKGTLAPGKSWGKAKFPCGALEVDVEKEKKGVAPE